MASKCSKDECIQENVSSYEEYCSVSGLFFLLLQYVILKKTTSISSYSDFFSYDPDDAGLRRTWKKRQTPSRKR